MYFKVHVTSSFERNTPLDLRVRTLPGRNPRVWLLSLTFSACMLQLVCRGEGGREEGWKGTVWKLSAQPKHRPAVLPSVSSYTLGSISVITFPFSILSSCEFGSSPRHLSPSHHNSLSSGLAAFRVSSSNPVCMKNPRCLPSAYNICAQRRQWETLLNQSNLLLLVIGEQKPVNNLFSLCFTL